VENYEWAYATEYLDHWWGVGDGKDMNLEVLLGVQAWRYCVFCPMQIQTRDEEDERFQKIYAMGDNSVNDFEDDFIVMDFGGADAGNVRPMVEKNKAFDEAEEAGAAIRSPETTSTSSDDKEKRETETEGLDEDAP